MVWYSPNELRRLNDGHPGTVGSNRLKEIILQRRPALAVRADGTIDAPAIIDDFETSRDRLLQVAGDAARWVGLVVVTPDGGTPKQIGTAFRLRGFARRMVTSRHLLTHLLKPGTHIGQSRPLCVMKGATMLAPGDGLHPCQVEFEDQRVIPVDPQLVWAHPCWDLMVFDLQQDDPDPAGGEAGLPLETDIDWGTDGWADQVCVIGYPLDRTDISAPDYIDPFVHGLNGQKYVSPGLQKGHAASRAGAASISPDTPRPEDYLGQHDCSALPGSSGSPVISIETGKVIGIHAQGGQYDYRVHLQGGTGSPDKGNYFVQIAPALAREQRLVREMADPTLHVQDDVAWQPSEAAETGAGESIAPVAQRAFADGSDILNVLTSDVPDARDARYIPAFTVLQDSTLLPDAKDLPLLRMQNSFDCVGHAVATAVDIAMMRAGFDADLYPVSARMIYETSRLFDEFADNRIGGSSLRGALKGLFHSGVCPRSAEPRDSQPWFLDIERAKQAREVRLMAYYRLRASVSDIQHAVATTGAVLVSARIHDGWQPRNANGRIPWPAPLRGRHAFVIVGYNRDGWYVRNSWGDRWSSVQGRRGVALWTYEDWRENVLDAWVLQLAPRTPKAFEVPAWVASSAKQAEDDSVAQNALDRLPLPRRHTLIGHALQVESDVVLEGGRLGVGLAGLRETALFLSQRKVRKRYPTIALICHDPFLTAEQVARLSGELVGPLKREGIYPINLAYGMDEAQTIRLRTLSDALTLARRIRGSGEDATRFLLPRLSRSAAPLIRRFRDGLESAGEPGNPLWQVIMSLQVETGPFGTGRRKRDLLLIGFGAGAMVADTLQAILAQADPSQTARRVDLGGFAPPGGSDQRMAVPLTRMLQANPVLHGFQLDWIDLVAVLAGDLQSHRDVAGDHIFATDLYGQLAALLRQTTLAQALDRLTSPNRL